MSSYVIRTWRTACVNDLFEKEVSVKCDDGVTSPAFHIVCIEFRVSHTSVSSVPVREALFQLSFLTSRHVLSPLDIPHVLLFYVHITTEFFDQWRSSLGGKWKVKGVTIGLFSWELFSFPCVSSRGPCDQLSFRSCWSVQPLTLLEGKQLPQCPIHPIQISVRVNVWHSRGMTIPWQSFIKVFFFFFKWHEHLTAYVPCCCLFLCVKCVSHFFRPVLIQYWHACMYIKTVLACCNHFLWSRWPIHHII